MWAERTGTGTPVVLLHGAGMDARLWDAIVPELALHHDVIRYDARGLGRSTLPAQRFCDVEDLAAVPRCGCPTTPRSWNGRRPSPAYRAEASCAES